MRVLIPLALLFSISASGCVMWAPARGVPDGSIEARASGSAFYGDTSTDDLADSFRFDIAALYGINDRFQIGPMFEWGIGEVEIGGIQVVDREMTNVGVQALYCFQPQAQMTPYALLNLGVVDIESDDGFVKADDTGSFLTLGLGLRSQVNRRFAVHGELRATRRELDRKVGGDWSELGIFLGFSYVFGDVGESESREVPQADNPWRQPGGVIHEPSSATPRDAQRLWHE